MWQGRVASLEGMGMDPFAYTDATRKAYDGASELHRLLIADRGLEKDVYMRPMPHEGKAYIERLKHTVDLTIQKLNEVSERLARLQGMADFDVTMTTSRMPITHR